MNTSSNGAVYDHVIVGTGFAGAVAYLRLIEAGQNVIALERGRRYLGNKFPKIDPLFGSIVKEDIRTATDLLKIFGPSSYGSPLWNFKAIDDLIVASGCGVGGGSLVYANVHLRPPNAFFSNRWPKQYREDRAEMDSYYDLAAWMLEVEPLPDELRGISKVDQFRRAAEKMGESVRHFYPPLAVRFSEKDIVGSFSEYLSKRIGTHTEPPRGAERGVCDLGGRCWIGCRANAKNSLDKNYFALAEVFAREQRRSSRVVQEIMTSVDVDYVEYVPDDDTGFYRVHGVHHDLIRGTKNKKFEVCGRHVHLCAGAPASAEILYRSRLNDALRESARYLPIGASVFTNSNQLAAVVDTEQPQETSVGPTITSALVHHPGTGTGTGTYDEYNWIMVQDGGVPRELSAFLGVFSSPLWFRRNRYRESDFKRKGKLPSTLPVFADVSRMDISRPECVDPISVPRYPKRNRVPEDLGTRKSPILRWLPDEVQRSLADDEEDVIDGVTRYLTPVVDELLEKYAATISRIVQSQVKEKGSSDSYGETNGQDSEIGSTPKNPVSGSADSTGQPSSSDLQKLLERIGLPIETGVDRISRGILRAIVQIGGGSEANLVRLVVVSLSSKLFPNRDATNQPLLDDMVRSVVRGLFNTLNIRPDNGFGNVYEVIGRDTEENRFIFDKALKRFGSREKARLAGRTDPDAISNEVLSELLLRDLANGGLQGDLRLNPLKVFGEKSLAVHVQGGCGMVSCDQCKDGTEPDRCESGNCGIRSGSRGYFSGVTFPNGQVIGQPGLFVLDASAFPESVGVNPSATILSVAERKLTQILEQASITEGMNSFQQRRNEAVAWAGDREWLRCVPTAKTARTDSKEVGLRFSEKPLPVRERGKPLVITFEENLTFEIDSLKKFLRQSRIEPRPWVRAVDGKITLKLNEHVVVKGHCDDQKDRTFPEISDIVGRDGLGFKLDKDRSKGITFFNTRRDASSGINADDEHLDEKVVRYDLVFSGKRKERGVSLRLTAEKVLSPENDRFLEVIEDALLAHIEDVELRIESDGTSYPISDLTGDKLAIDFVDLKKVGIETLKVTNTDDPTRQLWARKAFMKFLAREFAAPYITQTLTGQRLKVGADMISGIVGSDGF